MTSNGSSPPRRPRVLVLYQYQQPDDVVSARLFDDLCQGLARRGWDVEARPSNRSCHAPRVSYPLREHWHGVSFRRVWRPPLAQASGSGRILNAGWLVSAWLADLALRRDPPDVVLVGTDPILGVALAAPLRRLRSRVRIAHWVFDVYPEAAVADGLLTAASPATAAITAAMRRAYRACDVIADLGPRMRERLEPYASDALRTTLPPWALVEPQDVPTADPATRQGLFGDAALGLLHSGSFGRAHDPDLLIALARRLQGTGVRTCFAGRGHRIDALRSATDPSRDAISFADFCPEAELTRRLSAADVHLVSLRAEWSGLVVPSKFFGALAVGRPVVFAGPPDSDIGRWITALGLGWVLTAQSLDTVVADLAALATDSARLSELRRHCHATYHAHFGRERTIDRWHELLMATIGRHSARVAV